MSIKITQNTANLETLLEQINNLPEVNNANENGATFKPYVDEEGNISWTNDKGLVNPTTTSIRGPVGERGINGLGIYYSSEKNLQETNNKIVFSKISNYNREMQIGDIIILNDLSHSVAIVKEINEDSVTVSKTLIEMKGRAGIDGKNGPGVFTARRTLSSPDGYYDDSGMNYPEGRDPIVGDLLIFEDYGISRITSIASSSEISLQDTGINIKGAPGESVTITEIVETEESGEANTVQFNDGKTLFIKNGKDGKNGINGSNGTSVTIQNISQSTESGEISTITFSDGKKLIITNGKDGKEGKDGKDGTNGYSGVYVGSSEPPVDANVKIDPNGDGSTLIIPEVLQTTGDSEVDTMSQKAITELLSSISGGGGSGEPARSIVSIKRTSGSGAAGSTDTYTITYTDGTTSTFTVYNGTNGTNGKTAYESAKSGGYTGTETNFNTVLNNVTKYSTETWTFTLEDDSTVTKKVVISS